jgi:hypothetical protein
VRCSPSLLSANGVSLDSLEIWSKTTSVRASCLVHYSRPGIYHLDLLFFRYFQTCLDVSFRVFGLSVNLGGFRSLTSILLPHALAVFEPVFGDDWWGGDEYDAGVGRVPWRGRVFDKVDQFGEIGFVAVKWDVLESSR